MSKKIMASAAIVGLVVLIGIGFYAYNAATDNGSTEKTDQSVQQTDASESQVYRQYAAMKGETYDRNFIANMIAHHQGAVDMAKLAQANAKHAELKAMADDIVSAQEKEISDMLAWQKQWGYPSTSADNMMDHSAMGMMDEMGDMTAKLHNKSGDEFDKAFISLMIVHHQSAIDMARPGSQNAQHDEVKQLTQEIVTAQTKEIEQMRQWQRDWGYER